MVGAINASSSALGFDDLHTACVDFPSLYSAVMWLALLVLACGCLTCDFRNHPKDIIRRMQPDARNATSGPRGPLEWGQLNFIHTTDTHGWLEGHLKQRNYGADWGDFASFTHAMRCKSVALGVDLLLVDTGVRLYFKETLSNSFRTCMTGVD